MERNQKLSVDTIGTVVKDFTSINRREAPDVLPGSIDVGMGKASLEDEEEDAGKGTGAGTGAGAAPASAATTVAASTSSSGSSSKPAAGSGAAAGAKGKGKGTAEEVGPHSEMEVAENYNNFAITHEVREMVVSLCPRVQQRVDMGC